MQPLLATNNRFLVFFLCAPTDGIIHRHHAYKDPLVLLALLSMHAEKTLLVWALGGLVFPKTLKI